MNATGPITGSGGPVHVHPENGKIFRLNGKPIVLLTATEHYGAVMNRPFRFGRYLADAADKRMTLTRLFTLFRELQSAVNPYSTCKPESPDYVAPFRRVGPGRALDGEPVYDLDLWNPEFFDRLHGFLSLAAKHGIVVEVTLLSNTYCDAIWALNPLHPRNNINGLEDIKWAEYMSRRHPRLFARQLAHVQKIVQETNRYDNVIYEICNEPGGLFESGAPTLDEVNDWQMAVLDMVRDTEAALPKRHLIAGQEAFAYHLPDESHRSGPDVFQFADRSFDTLRFDVVNMHPLSNMVSRGKHHDLGEFMRGNLRLENLQAYCLAVYRESKPVNLDEDNAASQYKNRSGWTIHRKRAWTALFCGAHYDVIDFSIINHCEKGTPDSRRCIRSWMKHLSAYIHSTDIVRAKPSPEIVRSKPEHVVASVLAVPGKEYHIYLADGREADHPGAGTGISGELICDLPTGEYTCSTFSPVDGATSVQDPLRGSSAVRIHLDEFRDDRIIHLSLKTA